MASSRIPIAEVDRQLRLAKAAEKRDRAAGRRALAVRYDRASGRIILDLTNGCVYAFPAVGVPAIANFSHDQLATVKLGPGGGDLEWEAEDMQLSVPGLLMAIISRTEKMREFARMAGSVKSAAKSAAARRNGKKGGRPRKTARR